jgi:hypothetical protein
MVQLGGEELKEDPTAALDDFFVLFRPTLDLVKKLIQIKSSRRFDSSLCSS